MKLIPYPTIDLPATGRNIQALRQAKGYSVRDLQLYFGFQEPQAIYKWQRGECLPSVDNLFALSTLLGVPINDILIPNKKAKPQADACGFGRFIRGMPLLYSPVCAAPGSGSPSESFFKNVINLHLYTPSPPCYNNLVFEGGVS